MEPTTWEIEEVAMKYGLRKAKAKELLKFYSEITFQYISVMANFERGIEERFPSIPCAIMKELSELYEIEDIFYKLYGIEY